jgi:hypothetical protein
VLREFWSFPGSESERRLWARLDPIVIAGDRQGQSDRVVERPAYACFSGIGLCHLALEAIR